MMEKNTIDILWVLICSGLVFMMQAGFLCLESGLTRAKNAINVAIKNITDFGISVFLFWSFGFGLMFGASKLGWIGSSHFFMNLEGEDPWLPTFFIFQAMFCATATTIVSGAIAERTRFLGYVVMSIVVSGFIYPVFGHWAWGNELTYAPGWLQEKGFVDFAGSTVVHSVGGWVALACMIVVGPRTGRFLPDGRFQKISGSNLPMALLGVLILFFSWIGFNGGSALEMNANVSHIIAITALGAVSGMIVTSLIGYLVYRSLDVTFPMNGTLAGLVSVTANCHAISAVSAILIGGVGGIIMLVATHLLRKNQIDDVVGAVPVHLAAGIWGTIAFALFCSPEFLTNGISRWQQLQIQLVGVVSCGIYVFGSAYCFFRIINRFMPLRVSEESELIGLNIAEHDEPNATTALLSAMEEQALTGDLSKRVPVESFTEIGQIAEKYNFVIDLLNKTVARTNNIIRSVKEGIITFTQKGTILSSNPSFENLFFYSPSELKGKPFIDILSDEESNSAKSGKLSIQSLIEAEHLGKEIKLKGKRKDGTDFPLELTVTEAKEGDETVYTGTVRDLTRRKAVEEHMKVLSFFPKNNPNPIFRVAKDLTVLFANDSGRELLEEQEGRASKVLPKSICDEIKEVFASDCKKECEVNVGNKIYTCAMVLDASKEFIYLYAKDITELKLAYHDLAANEKNLRLMIKSLQKTHNQLRDAQKQVLQSEKLASIGELSAGISHEIKNPLAIIALSIDELAEQKHKLDEEGQMHVEMIAKAADRANKVILELLKFSRISDSSFDFFDLHELIEEALELSRNKGKEKHIDFSMNFSDENIKVFADNILLVQVFVNLISNAVDAIDQAGKVTVATVFEQRPGRRRPEAVIEITDDGEGMSEEVSQNIFNPFFTTKEQGEGTGLGLSTVYNIVKTHEGQIEVESTPGEGTKFVVILPGKTGVSEGQS